MSLVQSSWRQIQADRKARARKHQHNRVDIIVNENEIVEPQARHIHDVQYRKPRKLKHLKRDSGYRFTEKHDPVLSSVCRLISDSGLSLDAIAEKAEVSHTTLYSWTQGKVRNPQNSKVEAVLKALGYSRPIIADTPQLARQ